MIPVETYIHSPIHAKDTDFYHGTSGPLFFGKRVYEGALWEILECCGEVLPSIREDAGEEFYILNPLACYNCLNRDESKQEPTRDGKVVTQIHKYALRVGRIGGEPVFTIPETYRTELLVSNARITPEDEFLHEYKQGGYTGLRFEKLWSERE